MISDFIMSTKESSVHMHMQLSENSMQHYTK